MIPEKLGRYEIQAEIGQGAMGHVYRALDPLFHRIVAIKSIKPEYISQDPTGDYQARFQREAQAMGGLSHPNIVSVYDVGESYFVMEYLEGITLLTLLAQRERLPLGETLPIISPVADALDYAHRRGIIHRDIKPANIMILPDGRPKIMDFGLAHLESTVMTTAGQFLGSPSYMSPEQVTGDRVTARSDIYALGVVTYEMLTGKKPFAGSHVTTIIYRVVNEKPDPPRKYNSDLPPRFDDVFEQVLEKKPERRFATATDFIAALNVKEIGELVLDAMPTELPQPVLEPEPSEAPPAPTTEARDASTVETTNLAGTPGAPTAPAREAAISITARKTGAGTAPAAARSRAALLAAGALATAVVAGVVWTLLRGPAGEPTVLAPAVRVDVEPAGAVVELDGQPAGTAPLTLPPLVPGLHTVRVSREGFETEERRLELAAGVDPGPLRFELKPAAGTLSLRSEPEGATVKVDGELVGSSPLSGHRLPPGPHQIVVERKDYRPWGIEVESRPGETLNLTARLTRDKAASPPAGSSTTSSSAPPKPQEGELVELGPDVVPPRKLSGSPAPYPPAAQRGRIQGTVTVEMIVSETGEPQGLKVVESGGPILDEAVLRAVATWRYQPAEKMGVKVKVRWQVRQSFKLGG
jgi:serine/threonine-protein kinase